MSDLLSDGQHKHEVTVNVMNCFFCLQNKKNCSAYVVKLNKDAHPDMSQFEGQKFAICHECFAKGHDYIAKHIAQHAVSLRLLRKFNG
jgi:hypothetical protein